MAFAVKHAACQIGKRKEHKSVEGNFKEVVVVAVAVGVVICSRRRGGDGCAWGMGWTLRSIEKKRRRGEGRRGVDDTGKRHVVQLLLTSG